MGIIPTSSNPWMASPGVRRPQSVTTGDTVTDRRAPTGGATRTGTSRSRDQPGSAARLGKSCQPGSGEFWGASSNAEWRTLGMRVVWCRRGSLQQGKLFLAIRRKRADGHLGHVPLFQPTGDGRLSESACADGRGNDGPEGGGTWPDVSVSACLPFCS